MLPEKIKTINRVFTFIVNHPLNRNNRLKALKRFLGWQISRFLNPNPSIFPFAEKSRFIMKHGMNGATGNYYCGLDEFEDMAFILHFLRKTDLFIDIGANVGSYTILSASEVGAQTISIEPIPQTFDVLAMNVALNNLKNTELMNIGLSSRKDVIKFTKSLDTTNHVATQMDTETVDVQVEKFDEIINIECTALIKIDVEGFETEVINGMEKALENDNLKGIIIEMNQSGNRFGFDEKDIHKKLLSYNFKPFIYSPFERKLSEKGKSSCSGNSIYLRDLDLVNERILSAHKFNIHNNKI